MRWRTLLLPILAAALLLPGCTSSPRQYFAGLWGKPQAAEKDAKVAQSDAAGSSAGKAKVGGPTKSTTDGEGRADIDGGRVRVASRSKVEDVEVEKKPSGTIFSAFSRKREPQRDLTTDPFLEDEPVEQVEFRRHDAPIAAKSVAPKPPIAKSDAATPSKPAAGSATVAGTGNRPAFAEDFDSQMTRLRAALADEPQREGRLDWNGPVSKPIPDAPVATATANNRSATDVTFAPPARATASAPTTSAATDDIGFRSPTELASSRSVAAAEPALTTPFAQVDATPEAAPTATEQQTATVAPTASTPVDREGFAPVAASPAPTAFAPIAAIPSAAESATAPTLYGPALHDAPVAESRTAPATTCAVPASDLPFNGMIVESSLLSGRRESRTVSPVAPEAPTRSHVAEPAFPASDPEIRPLATPVESPRPLIIAPRPTAQRSSANRPHMLQASHVEPQPSDAMIVDTPRAPKAAAMQSVQLGPSTPVSATHSVETSDDLVAALDPAAMNRVAQPLLTVPESTGGPRMPVEFQFAEMSDDEIATTATPSPLPIAATSAAPAIDWQDEPLAVAEPEPAGTSHRGTFLIALSLAAAAGLFLRRRFLQSQLG